jgi:putative endonuclease
MHYLYILWSESLEKYYYGTTKDLDKSVASKNKSVGAPWKLVYYSAFETEKMAIDFEKYLQTSSGKALAHERLLTYRVPKQWQAPK